MSKKLYSLILMFMEGKADSWNLLNGSQEVVGFDNNEAEVLRVSVSSIENYWQS